MTELSWPWDTEVAGVGDGASQLNEARTREFLALYFRVQDPAVEGVCKGVLGELEVTGNSSPLDVEDGAAVCYGLYLNDAAMTLAVSTPAIGTTGGRVVLRTNWAGTSDGDVGEAETRLAVNLSSDGVASIPALTQSFGTTWEISLATFTITTGGVITVTDDRTFRMSTAMVDTDEIHDLAVETGKIDDLAVTTAKIDNLGVTTGKINNLAVTSGKIGANAVIAGKLADGAVDTTARLANDIVDDTKVGNRVPQFYRRQGGDASDWSSPGTTTYTPTTLRMQGGVIAVGPSSGGTSALITFPTAFSNIPLVMVTANLPGGSGRVVCSTISLTASGFQITWQEIASGTVSAELHWLAIGPE